MTSKDIYHNLRPTHEPDDLVPALQRGEVHGGDAPRVGLVGVGGGVGQQEAHL